MYFPYLRGRQYELIAIRDLLENNLISDKIIPVIEPIKLTRSLIRTLTVYAEAKAEIIVVMNPEVGNFESDLFTLHETDLSNQFYELINSNRIMKGVILNESAYETMNMVIGAQSEPDEVVSISLTRDALGIYEEIRNNLNMDNIFRYNLIPDDRRFIREVSSNKILFGDAFNKRRRNADYLDVDEFFSDNHIWFSDEGFDGFSDFSIVGEEYSDSGFAPWAVAIHMVYLNESDELYVKHFVSDSNDGIRDPAGKFHEAVEKLYIWGQERSINTFGYQELINHYHNETYPGLGVVKKLSIMHHLELISQYLGE